MLIYFSADLTLVVACNDRSNTVIQNSGAKKENKALRDKNKLITPAKKNTNSDLNKKTYCMTKQLNEITKDNCIPRSNTISLTHMNFKIILMQRQCREINCCKIQQTNLGK